jgi:hypothetical protein
MYTLLSSIISAHTVGKKLGTGPLNTDTVIHATMYTIENKL